MAYLLTGYATDWTGGTGVIPAGGSITIPANSGRKYLLVSNQGAANITVTIDVVISGGTSTSTFTLQPGQQLEQVLGGFVPSGNVVITGTVGGAVVAWEF